MEEHKRTGPLDLVTWSISRVAMWLPMCIVSIIFFEVMMRYVFGSPTMWVNETSLWIAGALYLLAGIYSMQQRSHIRIYILYDLCPRWLRRTCDVISVFCIVVFAVALIWGGFDDALRKFLTWERFGTKFDPPIPATLKPLILITMAILALQAISNLIYDWNTDQGESQLAENVSELMGYIGGDQADARSSDAPSDQPAAHDDVKRSQKVQ